MKVLIGEVEYNLRLLNDREYTEAERLARQSGVSLDVCPTCGGRDEEIPGSGGVRVFRNGTFRYRGETHDCNCQAQIALRARYLLANIGEQYMRLDWSDFNGSEKARNTVKTFLCQWMDFKRNGMGLEFGGPLGVGKTFAATHIGKELIKRGQRVFFCHFKEMISAFEKEDAEEIERRMRETTFLILDEILMPGSWKAHDLYADRFETLIRHRTNHNLPTIITTNLNQDELDEYYPRTYSLLAAKQLRTDMSGSDVRKDKIALENLELTLNSEVRPIT